MTRKLRVAGRHITARGRTTFGRRSLLIVGAACALVAALIALGVTQDEAPSLAEVPVASTNDLTPTTMQAPPQVMVMDGFALTDRDLECDVPGDYRLALPPAEHVRVAPTADGSDAQTSPTTERSDDRLVHSSQRSPQDVADNIVARMATKYPEAPIGHLDLVVTASHTDAVQFAARVGGKLKLLVAVVQRPDGNWDWAERISCHELWVAA
jgi:hypothetical protein